jgi:hypothetical protein
LGKHTTQFDVPRARRLAGVSTPAPGGFFPHHGYTRAVDLHIHHRNRGPDRHRQIQLHGLLHDGLLPIGDVAPEGLSDPLHSLGRDFQAGQRVHLFAAPVKRGTFAPD